MSCCRNNDPIPSQQSSFPQSDPTASVMLLYSLHFLCFPAVSAAAGLDPSGELAATTQEVTVNAKKQLVLTNNIRSGAVEQAHREVKQQRPLKALITLQRN